MVCLPKSLFSSRKKTALKSGLQTTKIAKYFETAAILTGNGDQTALNEEGGGENQQSDSGHGNSWLYSYFHLLIKEILTAANTNRVRALAESVQFLNVYTHGCGRDNNPRQSLTFQCAL